MNFRSSDFNVMKKNQEDYYKKNPTKRISNYDQVIVKGMFMNKPDNLDFIFLNKLDKALRYSSIPNYKKMVYKNKNSAD